LKIRIFLAGGLRRLLHDIVREAVATQPDMKVVGDSHNGQELHHMLAAGDVDLVIVGAHQSEDISSVASILYASPQVKLLAIEDNGRTATIYRLRPHQLSLGEMSPQELLAAIRTEAASQ
jgi:DNA-binding NarL/FixJ family response regulator